MKRITLITLLIMGLMYAGSAQAQDTTKADVVARVYQGDLQQIETARTSGKLSILVWPVSLEKLAPHIGTLKNLKELHLFQFHEKAIPIDFAQFPDLTVLGISDAKWLTEFPTGIGSLSKVESIHFSSTKLTSVSPEIGRLTHLQNLSFYGSPLRSLPPEIGQLERLEILDLSRTQLETLPSEIGQLTNLKTLVLYGSSLKSLSPQIDRLSNLEYLDLANTHLTRLPVELGHLTKLKTLYLYDTPLVFPPRDIAVQGADVVLAYLRDYEAMLMRQTISAIAAGFGALASLMLLFRWRQRRGLTEKKKRS